MASTDLQDRVGDYIESLKDTLFAAGVNWGIYWIYKGYDSREPHRQVIDRYTHFFAISLHAHFVASIIATYRALETNPKSVNFHMLLDHIRDAQMLPEPDVLAFRQRLDTLLPTWRAIAIIRNNVFAHENRDRNSDYYFSLARVTYDQIAALITDMQGIFTSLTTSLYNNPVSFETSIPEELVRLLTDLRHAPNVA